MGCGPVGWEPQLKMRNSDPHYQGRNKRDPSHLGWQHLQYNNLTLSRGCPILHQGLWFCCVSDVFRHVLPNGWSKPEIRSLIPFCCLEANWDFMLQWARKMSAEKHNLPLDRHDETWQRSYPKCLFVKRQGAMFDQSVHRLEQEDQRSISTIAIILHFLLYRAK